MDCSSGFFSIFEDILIYGIDGRIKDRVGSLFIIVDVRGREFNKD